MRHVSINTISIIIIIYYARFLGLENELFYYKCMFFHFLTIAFSETPT